MGLCSSKSDPASKNPVFTNLDSTNLKTVPLSIIVQQAKSVSNDSQYNFIKSAINDQFNNVTFQQQIVPNSHEKLFNVISDGKLIHSTEYDGNVQGRRDIILSDLLNMAKNKLSSQF